MVIFMIIGKSILFPLPCTFSSAGYTIAPRVIISGSRNRILIFLEGLLWVLCFFFPNLTYSCFLVLSILFLLNINHDRNSYQNKLNMFIGFFYIFFIKLADLKLGHVHRTLFSFSCDKPGDCRFEESCQFSSHAVQNILFT